MDVNGVSTQTNTFISTTIAPSLGAVVTGSDNEVRKSVIKKTWDKGGSELFPQENPIEFLEEEMDNANKSLDEAIIQVNGKVEYCKTLLNL